MTFVSEPIEPEAGSFSTQLMSQGLASLPAVFTWRGQRYAITECLEHHKQSSPEAGGEIYLRRQEFLVRLDTDQLARLYVTRQAPAGASREAAKRRWFLYAIEPPATKSDERGMR